MYLLRPSQTALTLKYVVQTLKPKFSEGSNNRRFEDSVYTAYLKYLRAVASMYWSLKLTLFVFLAELKRR